MMTPRTMTLERIILRVWEAGQEGRGREEHELTTITLRLLDLLDRAGSTSLDAAAYLAVGCSFEKWRKYTAERKERFNEEFTRTIPDYDPQEEARLRRSTPGRGPVPQVQQSSRAAFDDLLRILPEEDP